MDTIISPAIGNLNPVAVGFTDQQHATSRAAEAPSVAKDSPTASVVDNGSASKLPNDKRLDVMSGLDKQDRDFDERVVLRDAMARMDSASGLFMQVAETLSQAVKDYPPYPSDMPVKDKLLNEINGLRQQIERLTWPPESQNVTGQEAKAVRELQDQVSGLDWGSFTPEKLATSDVASIEAMSKKASDVADEIDQMRGKMWSELTEQLTGMQDQEARMLAAETAKFLANAPATLGDASKTLLNLG